MTKIAVVDMMFRWPPDGGARVDVKEVVSRLAKTYHVALFVPRVRCIIARGEIDESVPFRVVPVPFERDEFTGPVVVERFKEVLAEFSPDLVFLADGFHMKPWVAQSVKDYPYIVKFYAYENLCQRYNGTFMRGDRSCYRSGAGASPVDQMYCSICGLKTAVLSRLHGDMDFYLNYMNARAWMPSQWRRVRKMLDHAQRIIVYNQRLEKILALRGWKSVVIPGGLNRESFPQKAPRKPDGTVRLGIIGRIRDEQKGVIPAIRAMSILQQRGIPAELHITGTPKDNPRVLPGVVFRGWFPHDQLSAFYESVDIVLVPSIWQEPFGIVILEAMCSGRPVVASRVAGPMEIIEHGVNGRLAAPMSAVGIAEEVIRYLENPQKTAEIVDRAARTAREKYDWDAVYEAHYLPLFQQVLDELDGV